MTKGRLKTLGCVFALIVAIVTVSYHAYQRQRHVAIEAIRTDSEKQLAILKTALFAPTEKHRYLPELIASDQRIVSALRHANDANLRTEANRFLRQVNGVAKAAELYVLSASGTKIASSNWRDDGKYVGQNFSTAITPHELLKARQEGFRRLAATALRPALYIFHSIGSEGRFLGLAVIEIDMSGYDEGWNANNSEVAVVDDSGVIVLTSMVDWKYRRAPAIGLPTLENPTQRQYYGAQLKHPLPLIVEEQLKGGDQIVTVRQAAKLGKGMDEVRYLVRSEKLDGSNWTINVLNPLAHAENQALRIAIMSAGAIALLVLAYLYIRQARSNRIERQASQISQELAHRELKRKHDELESLSEKLHRIAITDPLTGAYNRRFLLEAASKLVSSACRYQHKLAVALIDVDHFKKINDTYGHHTGDEVLKFLTMTFQDSLRESDVFARYGGEEFIILLPNTDEQDAYAVVERIRSKIAAAPIPAGDASIRVTISIGISAHRIGEVSINHGIRRADDALYASKSSGRNRVTVG